MEPSDIDFVMEVENNPDNWRSANNVLPYSRYDFEQFVYLNNHDPAIDKQIRFVIESLESGQACGTADLFFYDAINRRAETGIYVHHSHRGKGIAKEALSLVIDYAFNTLGIHQLYSLVDVENQSSRNLFLASGFEQTGLHKDWFFYEGRFHDAMLFQKINQKNQP